MLDRVWRKNAPLKNENSKMPQYLPFVSLFKVGTNFFKKLSYWKFNNFSQKRMVN